MKKIIILIMMLFMFNISVYAYEIENYIVTIEPRKDASLDVTYDITLKVTEIEGINYIEIPILNKSIGEVKSLSNTIESITMPVELNKVSSYKLKIYQTKKNQYFYIKFNKHYNIDEIINFKYSFNQASVARKENDVCKFTFTPAWIGANNILLKWKAENVKNSNATGIEGEYIVWKLENLNNIYKTTLNVEYNKDVFKINYFKGMEGTVVWIIIFLIIIICFIISYFKHRGYTEEKYIYIEEEYKTLDGKGNPGVKKYKVKYLNNAGKRRNMEKKREIPESIKCNVERKKIMILSKYLYCIEILNKILKIICLCKNINKFPLKEVAK